MYQKEFDVALKAIKEAGEIIRKGYLLGASSSYKEDGTIVTNVDKEVDTLLMVRLASAFPNYGFLTEESKDDLLRLDKEYIWIIDPIDGTVEFVNHNYEFVTNIALCKDHQIVLSLINEPISDTLYYAIKGEGSFILKDNKVERIRVSDRTTNLICLSSPYHMSKEEEEYINKYKDNFKEVKLAGAAYKACLIASGNADVSYRFGANTKEWDTAAPDLLVREAGGVFLDKNKKPITYNKIDVVNHDGFIMVNKIDNYFGEK